MTLWPSSEFHSAGPCRMAISQPSASTRTVEGRPSATPVALRRSKASKVESLSSGRLVSLSSVRKAARLVHGVAAGVEIDRHDGEHVLAIGGGKGVEGRHLLAAGHAPGRPEIDEKRLAGEILEGHRPAGIVDETADRNRSGRCRSGSGRRVRRSRPHRPPWPLRRGPGSREAAAARRHCRNQHARL